MNKRSKESIKRNSSSSNNYNSRFRNSKDNINNNRVACRRCVAGVTLTGVPWQVTRLRKHGPVKRPMTSRLDSGLTRR